MLADLALTRRDQTRRNLSQGDAARCNPPATPPFFELEGLIAAGCELPEALSVMAKRRREPGRAGPSVAAASYSSTDAARIRALLRTAG